ncbi:unnamed protein product [Linum tenue]|uniref:Uncharacterized protein n=1 Tax=Linum tenue TaxID=586396 RepID=A0AAV0NC68_9ROSI|nr:unnamed protein product [Linum tenue]CAI0456032.1 unnamed protein product [Linum tenue]
MPALDSDVESSHHASSLTKKLVHSVPICSVDSSFVACI